MSHTSCTRQKESGWTTSTERTTDMSADLVFAAANVTKPKDYWLDYKVRHKDNT